MCKNASYRWWLRRTLGAMLTGALWAGTTGAAVTVTPIAPGAAAPRPTSGGTKASPTQSTQPQARMTKAFMWKVTSPTTTAYLLGSMHVAPGSIYPLSPTIEKAYADAGILVVEVDITAVDPTSMLGVVAQTGMYADGSGLKDHVAADTYKAFEAFCTEKQIPVTLLATMKPWLAGVSLTDLAAEQHGFNASAGIDMHFLTKAHDRKDKKIVELESVEGQLKLLSGMDDTMQADFLKSSVQEASQLNTKFDVLLGAWKAGDAKAMNDLVMEDYTGGPESRKLMNLLLFDRNVTMAATIGDLLKGKTPVFVVVGAAHLTGEKGVVKLLEQQHLKVEQPLVEVPAAATTQP